MARFGYIKQLFVGAVTLMLLTWGASFTWAQIACPYADIRLETALVVDVEAVCEAAKPWSEKGIRIFVLLTDFRPTSEDNWFAFLDQAEAEAGLRDLSRPDSFAKNALAIEASTSTDLVWGRSITLGEALYGTDLDTDAAAARLKNDLRVALIAGDPTGALVGGLETAYRTTYPPPSPLVWVGLGVLVVGAVGGATYFLTPTVIKPALERSRQRKALREHLGILQNRVSNLLAACDRLLAGGTPEETVLYQLFSAYGGEHDEAMGDEVREWLRRSQGALSDAFDLRQKLNAPALQEKRSLEDQVKDWELLYLTLAGSSERILTLTDDELHTLLDPMLILERETSEDVKLTAQLDDIRRELAGMPLKVELMMVDPAQTDAEGILGYLDQVQAQIAFLQEAQREAPNWLAEAQAKSQILRDKIPSQFTLTAEEAFAGIDAQLAQAETALAQDRSVVVLKYTEDIQQNLASLQTCLDAWTEHGQTRSKIDALMTMGYRPDHLADDLKEIEVDLQTITQKISAGNYESAEHWAEELKADRQRALESIRSWQELEQQNADRLRTLRSDIARLAEYQASTVTSAWESLQTYPEPNWSDVATGFKEATQTLQNFETVISQIERQNDLEVQAFTEAEAGLSQVTANLAQAEQSMQAVVNRLAEVQTAEEHLAKTLELAEADLAAAVEFRDQEDRKIGPEVDQQLAEAGQHLERGRQLRQVRNYIGAVEALSESRGQITAAYATASQQVQLINDLQTELKSLTKSVADKVGQAEAQFQGLPALVETSKSTDLTQQAINSLSRAKQRQTISADLEDQAWAEALRAAIAAYGGAAKQADEALSSISADRDTYNKLQQDVEKAMYEASMTIQRAEVAVKHRDAGGASQKALNRAKATLPQTPDKDASIGTLQSTLKKARETKTAAEQAEDLAQRAILAAKAKREQQATTWRPSAGGSWTSSPSWSSRSKSSWSASRPRSSSSSSGSRSTSVSHRANSTSSSKRRSSMGSSRRR